MKVYEALDEYGRDEHSIIYHARVNNYLKNKEIFGDIPVYGQGYVWEFIEI